MFSNYLCGAPMIEWPIVSILVLFFAGVAFALLTTVWMLFR